MKKMIAVIVVLFLTAILALPMFAAYPGSPDWNYPLPTDGVLITGTVFGSNSWGSTESSMPPAAFDGDALSFFDAAASGAAATEGDWVLDGPGFVGMQAAELHILTEIRVLPREGFTDRTVDAGIQASVDGKSWVQIYIFTENIGTPDYICVKAADFITNGEYTYFRYCQTGTAHCDVADVEFYGNPAAAAAPGKTETTATAAVTAAPTETQAPATVITEAPETADGAVIISVIALVALAAAVIIKKRK